MSKTPLISICIPAYRRTTYLNRLLDSINIQTYQHFEVVITDDSPDASVNELVEQHTLKSKIRYFKNDTTLGTPENWNEGIRKANFEWIKIMHDDDWFSGPDSLGHFANRISNDKYGLYFSAFSNVFTDGRAVPVHISDHHLQALQRNPEKLLAANRIGPPSVVIFKRDKSILFDNRMQWLVDVDFYIRYLSRYHPATFIDQNLIRIGIGESQVTRSSFGNPKIEIPERFLLAEKLRSHSLRDWVVYDSWWRFIRNLRIRDESEIADNGYPNAIPEQIRSMIRYQKNIPAAVLKIGLFSKLFMSLHYLRQKSSG
jgi:glycosyltransferase involved in cell wall biosynthesis